jgi:flagellar protein FlaG
MNVDATKVLNVPQSTTQGSAPATDYLTTQMLRAASADQTGKAASNSADTTAVQEAARQLETHMMGTNSALEFRVDTKTGDTVVTVRDKSSGDVIRQIPSEEALWLAQNLDKLSGALLSTSA